MRLVGAFRSMNSLGRAAVDGMHTADRLNRDLESSVAADAWQREHFRVLPELDDLARWTVACRWRTLLEWLTLNTDHGRYLAFEESLHIAGEAKVSGMSPSCVQVS